MTAISNRARRTGIAAAVLLCACLLAVSPDAHAKKKKGGKAGGIVDVTQIVNAPIPTAVQINPGPFNQNGALRSTIEVGKQFKGRQIRDVNVTVQTLGVSGNDPATDLRAILTAPNGGTVRLFNVLFTPFPSPNPSIGPLTLDDEARLELGGGTPDDPTQLYAPWAGTATADGLLAALDNGPVRGIWTLTVEDVTPSETSNLASWRLQVTAGRPFQTK